MPILADRVALSQQYTSRSTVTERGNGITLTAPQTAVINTVAFAEEMSE